MDEALLAAHAEALAGLESAVGRACPHPAPWPRRVIAAVAGEERPPPVPARLLVQARLAARNGVGLDTVLRRYFAGYALLCDALFATAVGEEHAGAGLKQPLRAIGGSLRPTSCRRRGRARA